MSRSKNRNPRRAATLGAMTLPAAPYLAETVATLSSDPVSGAIQLQSSASTGIVLSRPHQRQRRQTLTHRARGPTAESPPRACDGPATADTTRALTRAVTER